MSAVTEKSARRVISGVALVMVLAPLALVAGCASPPPPPPPAPVVQAPPPPPPPPPMKPARG